MENGKNVEIILNEKCFRHKNKLEASPSQMSFRFTRNGRVSGKHDKSVNDLYTNN